jgi:hypothetical protein
MSLPQYNLRSLLTLTVMISAAAALIADEPIQVGLATVFCFVSYNAIAALTLFSAENLWRKTRKSIADHSLRPFVSRIKWLALDSVIAVWLVASISITNYVLANHVKYGPWLLLMGVLTSPVLAYRLGLAIPRKLAPDDENPPTIALPK